ncbi:MAG: adenine deaminase C-terminal domain-containing protein, partial [Clostridia bacterium]
YVYKYNYPVIQDTIASTVYARSIGKGVDGNAPELFQNELAAHIICGGTDVSCHETTTKAEAIEKLRYGVYMLMREGSTQRNMSECIRAITEEGLDSRRAILATDDMLAEDIAKTGHMNDIIRRTIKQGVTPVEAIQMATINPATWLGLSEIGVLAPGKLADIAIITGELSDIEVTEVILGGKIVAKDKELLIDLPKYTYPDTVKKSVKREILTADELKISCEKEKVKINCIGLILDQNLSDALVEEMDTQNGFVLPKLEEDLLAIVNVGRHGQRDIGKSFVKGFKMKNGAFAESVAHDTHNIIAVGTNYDDIAVAVNRVIELQGGLALAKDGKIVGEMGLPVAGLITDELTAQELTEKMSELTDIAKNTLECEAHAPFMHLAFLALTTSPKWKLTDKGVVDANNYCVIPTIAE